METGIAAGVDVQAAAHLLELLQLLLELLHPTGAAQRQTANARQSLDARQAPDTRQLEHHATTPQMQPLHAL